MIMTRSLPAAASLLLCLCIPLIAHANDWYRWRGPEQNGVSRETGLPDKWDPDTGENLAWTAPVGGMSSPIVMNGKLYTLSRTGEEQATDTLVAGPKTQESVVCLDANTGKQIWLHAMNMTETEVPFHRVGWSNPAGDPATGRIYTFGAQCNLTCLEGDTGKVVWQRQMTEEFGVISTFGGRTPSPAVDEDQVFICGVGFGWGDNARAQYRCYAFDKKTGQLNWTTGTGGIPVDSPYLTPVITVVDGQKELIVGSGDGGVYGFQPRTGKLLWKYNLSKRGMNDSPIVDGSRVYIGNSEVNFDNAFSGTFRCIDVSGDKPRELWRQDRVEVGFSSPSIYEGRVYAMTDHGILYCFDAMTGKEYWTKRCGADGKASVVIADGKAYIPEPNGKLVILKLDDKKPTILSKVELLEKLGREYVLFGSVAIANGRVYLESANKIYCIGPRQPTNLNVPIPPQPQEKKDGDHAAAMLQVRPADVVLRPGEKQSFTLHYFDALGRAVESDQGAKAQWSVGQLTFQPPAKTFTDPLPPKIQIGNLKGSVTPDGTFTAENGPHQGGGVYAKAGDITGFARVRVLPPFPWKIDFEAMPDGVPPLTWLDAGGKFFVKTLEGNKTVAKIPNVDLYYRAFTNFGTPEMTNYTLQADVRAAEKVFQRPDGKDEHYIPDPGIVNQNYVMMLYGNAKLLEIHAWTGALPSGPRAAAGLVKRTHFDWEANKWYTMKFEVDQLSDKTVAHGKVWPAGEKEPAAWNIEVEDDVRNLSGSPGLFGHSLVTPFKSELYYDNILVTANK
jgi:outer membrane protein assembly factor BamB